MRGRHLLSRILPVLALLLAWEVAARLAGNRLFPPASAVAAALVQDARHGPLLHNLGVTLGRVAAAFTLAMVGGSVLGIVMGRMPRLDRALDSLLTGLLNLPALVSIVLIYVWFGLSEATAIAAVALNKLPSTAVTVWEGARALDLGLADMAHSFRMGRAATLRHVILPLSRTGVVLGSILVFTQVMGDYFVVKRMSGGQSASIVSALSTEIQAMQYPPASANAVVLVLVVALLVAAMMRVVDVRRELVS